MPTKLLLPTYMQREKRNIGDVNINDLVIEINRHSNNAAFDNDFLNIAETIAREAKSGDLILTMGAGDITTSS